MVYIGTSSPLRVECEEKHHEHSFKTRGSKKTSNFMLRKKVLGEVYIF